ncbi:MAG: peroxiredoxin [Hyphomicrobiaceae bacterium]
MKVFPHVLLTCLLTLVSTGAKAELSTGSSAPTFSVAAALGGKDLTFNLGEALTKGPVVVYFYPKSFTSVCTMEAHLFAEAMAEFETLGASVIGISTDTLDTQREFSRLECRDKLPVGADTDGSIVRAYDASLGAGSTSRVVANRTSYVITPDGKVDSVLTASDAESHIKTALKSIRTWKAKNIAR